MEISDKNYLDDFSDGLPVKLDGRKWDWLALRAVFSLLISLALVAKAAATRGYPLHASDNGCYVLDSINVPFLIIGHAPHSNLARLNNAAATAYRTGRV